MKIASYLDSTNLKSDSSSQDITKLCKEAKLYNMAAVCLLPYRVQLATSLLLDSSVKVCTVIGFPLGADRTEVKLCAAKQALVDGARELDLVINIGAIKDGDYNLVEDELDLILQLKSEHDFILKVIVETAVLTEEELIYLTKLVSHLECDYIKTSTGFARRGVNIEDIETINQYKSKELKIKASGGIRSPDFAWQLIDLGVNRIGTSNAIAILRGE
ncbi:MAG TPA: deoxyribose-phosphate aldolase [Syntrophomonadaceae bacterium]|nr:deoxyribose-phosphate aldolase [Syntrophomonadaceae bacterium]